MYERAAAAWSLFAQAGVLLRAGKRRLGFADDLTFEPPHYGAMLLTTAPRVVTTANIVIMPRAAMVTRARRGDFVLPDDPKDTHKVRRIKAIIRVLFPDGIAGILSSIIHEAVSNRLRDEDMAWGIKAAKVTTVSLSTIERAIGRRR
jgi:hypothetical protein